MVLLSHETWQDSVVGRLLSRVLFPLVFGPSVGVASLPGSAPGRASPIPNPLPASPPHTQVLTSRCLIFCIEFFCLIQSFDRHFQGLSCAPGVCEVLNVNLTLSVLTPGVWKRRNDCSPVSGYACCTRPVGQPQPTGSQQGAQDVGVGSTAVWPPPGCTPAGVPAPSAPAHSGALSPAGGVARRGPGGGRGASSLRDHAPRGWVTRTTGLSCDASSGPLLFSHQARTSVL